MSGRTLGVLITVLALVVAGAVVGIVLGTSGDDNHQGSAFHGSGTVPSAGVSDVPSPGGSVTELVPKAWEVGACIRQIEGPTSTPTNINDPNIQRYLRMQERFIVTSCADPQAVAKLTKPVPGVARYAVPKVAQCPDDTDDSYQDDEGNTFCARYLKAPHPGDPGGGAGAIVVGDCVGAGSQNAGEPDTEIFETACTQGFFAKVVAEVDTPSLCPADTTISRFTSPDAHGKVVCMGQGGTGLIAKPGDCFSPASNYYYPGLRAVDCSKSFESLISIVDTPAQCPSGTHASHSTGYDRVLCIRYADGS